MDLTPYIERLRHDLLQAAALGDDSTQRTAATLAAAVEPSIRLALMTALSDLAAEITGTLDGTTVEVKLDGAQVRVAIEHHGTHDDEGDEVSSPHQEPFDLAAKLRRKGLPEGLIGEAVGGDWASAMKDAGSELSRTTVRLFNDLKSQAESAASDQGVSLNTYISHAVADSVRGVKGNRHSNSGRRGRSVTGWIQG